MTRAGRPAAVALGSNLGNRQAHLAYAVGRLRSVLTGVVVSSFIETAPEHDAPGPMFLNGAIVGETDAPPGRLLARLLEIEQERGRERRYVGAPRTLDLDLVLLGDLVLDEPGLRIPHPRFRGRPFVLAPLAEIAPAMVDPESGLSMTELLARMTVGGRGSDVKAGGNISTGDIVSSRLRRTGNA